MENSPYLRSALAHAALDFVPPLIQRSLLEESAFRKEYNLKSDVILSIGDPGVTFHRSELFDAVRKVLAGSLSEEIIDTGNNKWNLSNIIEEEELPNLFLIKGRKRLPMPDMCPLSPDRKTRLRSFDKNVSNFNLRKSTRDRLSKILEERVLEDDEIDEYHSEFNDTPVEMVRFIHHEIKTGKINISSLVPNSRRYFERLVGTYDKSISIAGFATGSGKALFEQLSSWRPYDGFLLSLLLSSHSALTTEINVDNLHNDDLIRAYNFIDNYGDRISQLGAIEVGLRVLPSRPDIEPILIKLIKQIRDDDVKGKASGFKLLSALFVLVDGQLSRNRIFSKEPPFYRRLAALSQSALIHRQFVALGFNSDKFWDWTFSHCGEQFYFQSLADMRECPRWNPDMADASQLKAEFFGRLMIAANNYKDNITSDELADLLLTKKNSSLYSLSVFPGPYLPGPLEGENESNLSLPPEISGTIDTQLHKDEIGTSSFIALVNSAKIFRIEEDHAELAAQALEIGNFRLTNVQDTSQLVSILSGLATVAAVTRSRSLAEKLRILLRRYMRVSEYTIQIGEAINICLVAAASNTDLIQWRDFVGDWLTELSFGDLKDNEGVNFHSHLKCLCHAVPELWVSCGRADAALTAYNASKERT